MKKLWRKLAFLVRERMRARRLSKLVLALSLIVVFITTYALILPAITVSNSTSSSVIQSQEEPVSSLTDTSKTSSSSVESPASKPSSEEDKPTTDTNAQETKPSVAPETPKEAETSVAKEAGEQTAESGNVIVKASYPENTFSEKVTLKVTPISNTTAIDNKIKEVLSEKRQTLTVAHSYDISFVNEAGTEVEPNKEVSVSMTFKNTVSDDRLHSEWKLYHFKDNDVNQVEDLTKKADTTINETQSGDVTGVEFKSDKFSTYTIAGVNYADFTSYLTDGSYTGKATYTASSKILEASLNLGFKISQTDLVKNKNYAFQLPDNVSLGSGLYENQEYTGYDKDSGKEAYKFKVVTVNGKKYMAITFLDSYVNELTPNTDSTGQLHFSASIGEQWKKENGTYEIPFTDKVKITIPSKDIDKHEEPHQEQYDIHSQKTGKVTYDGDTAYLDYTVTVWSDKGTKDTVKVSDNITANGLTLEPLDVVKVERKDYSGWYGEEGTNKQTITGYAVNKGADNKSFNVTLPKLSAKQAYTITYRYKVSNFPAGKDFAVNNKIDVETPNAPHSHTETWLNLHRNKISKSGQYNKDTNKIKWTITVNENHNDIAGAVLKDEMLAKASDVTITPNNGFEKTSDGYKFTAVQNGKNTQKYTITYTTDAGKQPENWNAGNTNVKNKVTVTDGGDSSSTETTVDTGKGKTGGLDKKFEKMESTPQANIKELTWKSIITMPGDGKLPQGTEFEDVLKGQNGTNNGEHYFTKAQLDAIHQKLEEIFGKSSVELQIMESGNSNWQYVNYNQIDNNKTYKQFKFKLLKEYKSKNNVTLEYKSTINISNIVSFANTISSGRFSSEAKYKYEESGKVFKMDGNKQVWDGTANEFDKNTTQHEIQKDGTIDWVVKVKVNDDAHSVTITDTPPAALKLIGFEYGNSIYGIDSGVFTVTDTEIKLQNQYYTGQYGADVDVQGTISNGVVTVTFTAKNGKTLKQALKDTGALYARFKFKSDADPLDENVKKTYTNKASASIDGKPSGEAEHTQNITVRPGQKLSKNGTWNNTARQLEYNVVLNPEGKDLAAGKDSYTLTDTLTYQEDIPTKLSYDLIQSSVSLVDENNHEVDKSQWSWTVEKTKDASGLYKSILKVKVPNFKKYTLKYKYAVSREVAADNTTQLHVTNTAVIEGLKTGKTEKRVDYKWEKVNAGGTIVSNKAFNITKVDVNNFGIILPEATFEIRENITNKVVATYKTDASGKFSITKNSKNAVTGSQELENNKLYYAIEVKAPAGYELPEESKRTKYYFYFSELGTLPSNIGALTSADVVNLAKQSKSEYVPNTPLPKTTSIKVDKKWLTAEGAQTDRVDGSITVKLIQIATKENAGQGEKPEEVTLRTQTITKASNWTHTFDNLPTAGVNNQGQKVTYTYKVVEEKVEGYDTSYSTTSPMASGTITITNKKQKAYVLPKTGGPGLRLLIGMGIAVTLLSSSLLIYKSYQRYRKSEL